MSGAVILPMHQRRGVQAEAGAEPRGGRKGAGERSMAERRERGGRAAHTLSIADGTAEIASGERREPPF